MEHINVSKHSSGEETFIESSYPSRYPSLRESDDEHIDDDSSGKEALDTALND